MTVLWVALGGALGASLRYGVALALAPVSRWALATLLANVVGSLLLGGFMAWWLPRAAVVGESLRLFVAIGLLGGFTTFSTFSYDTLAMAFSGRPLAAAINVVVNLTGALGAVWLGWWLMRGWASGAGAV